MSQKQFCRQYGALLANPDRLAQHKAYQKAYREQHKEKLNLYHRKLREKKKKQYESSEAVFLRNAQKSLEDDMINLDQAKRHVKFLDRAREIRREMNRIISKHQRK